MTTELTLDECMQRTASMVDAIGTVLAQRNEHPMCVMAALLGLSRAMAEAYPAFAESLLPELTEFVGVVQDLATAADQPTH